MNVASRTLQKGSGHFVYTPTAIINKVPARHIPKTFNTLPQPLYLGPRILKVAEGVRKVDPGVGDEI
jgi:hypothetical protein